MTDLVGPFRSDELIEERDVVYAARDETALKGDLFSPPAAAGACPAFVFVHGGGWQAGDRASGHQWARLLAMNGVATFCVQYRLAKKAAKAFPEACEDIDAALAFLMEHPTRFDPSRMGLLGVSAGAHLAAQVALEPKASSRNPKVIVCVYGIYELCGQWEYENSVRPDNNLVEAFLGSKPAAGPELYLRASPINHLGNSERKPSMLISFGAKDQIVPPLQSEAFISAAQGHGYDIETFVARNAGHFWMSQPLEDENTVAASFARVLLRFVATRMAIRP